jgi:ribosome biogenesis GTPase A
MNEAKFIATIIVGVGSFLAASGTYIFENRKSIYNFLIHSFNKIFSSSIFKEKEINIIIKYLEEKYLNEIKSDLNILFPLLIENKKLLTKLADDVKKLSLKKNFKEEKKRIFLLGETGVGKSTLIN